MHGTQEGHEWHCEQPAGCAIGSGTPLRGRITDTIGTPTVRGGRGGALLSPRGAGLASLSETIGSA